MLEGLDADGLDAEVDVKETVLLDLVRVEEKESVAWCLWCVFEAGASLEGEVWGA